MSFEMMKRGYSMDQEDEDLVINEDYVEGITSCNKVSWQKITGENYRGIFFPFVFS